MQIRNWITSKRVETRTFALLSCLVLLSMFTHTVVLAAEQPNVRTPSPAQALNNPAHDSAMTGTVQRLITSRTPGVPAGFQLLVDGPQGSFTASLGSQLSREVQEGLSQGAPVQISGVMQTINDKEYLLARTLTVSGKQTIVRNENGFLVHTSQRSRTSANNSAFYRSAK